MERKRDQIIEYNNSLLESITHLEDEKVGLESQLKDLREEIWRKNELRKELWDRELDERAKEDKLKYENQHEVKLLRERVSDVNKEIEVLQAKASQMDKEESMFAQFNAETGGEDNSSMSGSFKSGREMKEESQLKASFISDSDNSSPPVVSAEFDWVDELISDFFENLGNEAPKDDVTD